MGLFCFFGLPVCAIKACDELRDASASDEEVARLPP
jgi:hypothetical protein